LKKSDRILKTPLVKQQQHRLPVMKGKQ